MGSYESINTIPPANRLLLTTSPSNQEQVIGIASLEQTAYCLTEYAGTYRLDRLDLTAPEKPCESLRLQLDAGAVPQGLVADTQGAILLAWDEARNQPTFPESSRMEHVNY